MFSKGGYIALKPNLDTIKEVYKLKQSLINEGVEGKYIKSTDLHMTLMYDASNPNPFKYSKSKKGYKLFPKELKIIGEGQYRSLALILEPSKELLERFNELKELGFNHSYPELLPHISILYEPITTLSEEQLTTILTNTTQLNKPLYLTCEYRQEIEE